MTQNQKPDVRNYCNARPRPAASLSAGAPAGWAPFSERGQRSTPPVSAGLNFTRDPSTPLSVLPPQFAAKVKRVIYLHMGGSPSQLDLFDYKPVLKRFHGQDCPQSFLAGKRFAFIRGVPKLLGPMFPFHQAGKNGTWISDRLPQPGKAGRRSVLHQVHEDRPVQPCPGPASGADRRSAHRTCLAGLLGHLRAGHREPEPAGLHRADLQRRHHRQCGQAALGLRLPAQRLSGRALPFGRRAGAVSAKPQGRQPGGAAPGAGCGG